MSNETDVSSAASASAVCALAQLDSKAGARMAKLISLVAGRDRRAIEIIGMYQNQEITVEKALDLVDEYLGPSN